MFHSLRDGGLAARLWHSQCTGTSPKSVACLLGGWHVERGAQYQFVRADGCEATPPYAVAFSSTALGGHLLAAADEEGTLSLIDTRGPRDAPRRHAGHPPRGTPGGGPWDDDSSAPVVASAGARVVPAPPSYTGSGGWGAPPAAPPHVRPVVATAAAHANAVFDVAWLGGDAAIATAAGDSSVRVHTLDAGGGGLALVTTLRGHGGSVKAVAALPGGGGGLLASAARDGVVLGWDTRCPATPVWGIRGAHRRAAAGLVPAASSLPASRAGATGSIRAGATQSRRASLPGGHARSAVATPPATPPARKRRRLSTAASRSAAAAAAAAGAAVTAVAAVPGRQELLLSAGAADGGVKVWDLRRLPPQGGVAMSRGAAVGTAGGGGGGGSGGGPSPGTTGSAVPPLSATGTPDACCLATLTPSLSRWRPRPRPFGIAGMDVAGGSLLASCTDSHIYIYPLAGVVAAAAAGDRGGGSGTSAGAAGPLLPSTVLAGHSATSFYVKAAFAPGGDMVLSGSNDSRAYVWDLRGKGLRAARRPGGGIREASPPADGLWAVPTGTAAPPARLPMYALEGHAGGEVSGVAWCGAEVRKLATAGDDTVVKVWTADRSLAPLPPVSPGGGIVGGGTTPGRRVRALAPEPVDCARTYAPPASPAGRFEGGKVEPGGWAGGRRRDRCITDFFEVRT
ncbi:hypothetical protein MMPV_008530 [Pyropia vietnamensis]